MNLRLEREFCLPFPDGLILMSTFPFPASVTPLTKETTQLHVSRLDDLFLIVYNEACDKNTFFSFLTTMGPLNLMFSQYFVTLLIFIDRLPSNFFSDLKTC